MDTRLIEYAFALFDQKLIIVNIDIVPLALRVNITLQHNNAIEFVHIASLNIVTVDYDLIN